MYYEIDSHFCDNIPEYTEPTIYEADFRLEFLDDDDDEPRIEYRTLEVEVDDDPETTLAELREMICRQVADQINELLPDNWELEDYRKL